MDRVALVRAAALYLPISLTAVAWLATSPTRKERAAALLATAWNVPALLALHAAALRFGWWRYDVASATVSGFPVDLYLGWAIGWGALPSLLGRRMWLAALVALAVAVDLVAMPRLFPVVHLSGTWLVGEGFGVLGCLIPAQLLASWTRRDANLPRRAALQALAFGGIALGVLPAVILEQSGGSWASLWTRPAWATSLLAQVVAGAALLGVSAVQEFAVRGGGTPVPFDAPKRLVTSGPYAFVRNPMQLSAALVMVGWGGMLGSWWVAAAGCMAVVYGAGFAAGDERGDLGARFGAPWRTYAQAVRSWLPRWRPFDPTLVTDATFGGGIAPATRGVATLYVAEECGPCSEVRAWFDARRPTGLAIIAAEAHPSRSLTRITYDPGDGTADSSGIAALGRALEHVHFGWALLGMFARLPGVCWLLQLVTDASGGGPKRVARYCERPQNTTAAQTLFSARPVSVQTPGPLRTTMMRKTSK